MGAVENASDEVNDDQSLDLVDLVERLDHGYTLLYDGDGQLRLVAPSPVEPGDAGPAAA